MKKLILLTYSLVLVAPFLQGGRGGDAAIGGFAGGIFGSMVGTAIAKDSGSASQAQQDAARAREESRNLRREQERDRYERIEDKRRESELRRLQDKIQEGDRTNPMVLMLIMLVVIFGLGLAILGYMLMRKKP